VNFKSVIISVILLGMGLSLSSFAKDSAAPLTSAEKFERVADKYKSAAMVQMVVYKEVQSDLMDKVSSYEGKIHYAPGKLRWENQKPEKSLLLFDGAVIWNVQYPTEDFPGPIQVAKAKIDKKSKSKLVFNQLLENPGKTRAIKIVSEKKEKGLAVLKVEFTENDPQFQNIEIKLNESAETINSVSYSDDIGNKTTLKFSQIKFLENLKSSLFKFKIPKGAQVTNL
jgi:outer membrane lipoprotein carrier protein